MSQQITTISLEAIQYMCGLIRDLASVSEAIDNTNLADDKVFSNLYTKKLIDKCLEDANTEVKGKVDKTSILTTIDNLATDDQVYSAKATYDLANTKANTNHTHTASDITDLSIPTKVSDLENDRGYLTSIPEEYITETKIPRVFYSEGEINKAHGTNIQLVGGEDNTAKILNALEPNEEFVNWFENNDKLNRFGIDESMGGRLNVISIRKYNDNEASAYAITNKGKIFSRFFQNGSLSEWEYDSTDLTKINTKMAQLETQVNDLFQSVSSGKTLVANAITGKGVSTSTTATFATMATNISKIITTYKEETKSYNNTSSGTTRLVFTFSADVSGVKQVTPPSDISSYIVPETSTSMFTIKGKELILYVNGNGTWKVTAFIKQ